MQYLIEILMITISVHIPETKTYRQDIQRLDRERYDCWGIFGAGICGFF